MAQASSTAGGKKVMVAIDESDCSHHALEWALENLDGKIRSSGLVLFHAISNDYTGVHVGTYGSAPPELIYSIQENQKKLGNALLEKAKEIASKHGIIGETVVELGIPKEAVCAAAEKLKVGLLVIGSHGRGALQRAFLGSVSSYVVHNAKCPVLVVRKPV